MVTKFSLKVTLEGGGIRRVIVIIFLLPLTPLFHFHGQILRMWNKVCFEYKISHLKERTKAQYILENGTRTLPEIFSSLCT